MSRLALSSLAFRVLALCIAICLLLVGACIVIAPESAPGTRATKQSESSVIATANAVLAALERKDGEQLASLVHPGKGVRFSPSAYIDLESDRVFFRSGVAEFWTDTSRYVWGYADGTGDPITMTPSEYWGRYILSRDFGQVALISINDDQANGNTTNNAATVYPQAIRVEYYIEASTGGPARHFDWTALRLVLERVHGAWMLVGVIHDQWSV